MRARLATVGRRLALRRRAARASVRRRSLPHQLRHAYVIELGHEGVPLTVIQRELGDCNLGVTTCALERGERIETVYARRPAMIPASAGLVLPLARWPTTRQPP